MKTLNTNWMGLDWDFSDSDSVNFGDFDVTIDQFEQGKESGYVIDLDGIKRTIDETTIKLILEDYQENWDELN